MIGNVCGIIYYINRVNIGYIYIYFESYLNFDRLRIDF